MPSCFALRTPTPPALWQRLERWNPDATGTGEPFTPALAREQGWSRRYAERVLAEYRRFLFLAVSAGHGVWPSDAVDRVWQLHRRETGAYRQTFCPQVLGVPLHHSPSRGSSLERQRLMLWYAKTLTTYRSCFGEAPPADIWPRPKRRFGRCGLALAWGAAR